MRSISEIQAQLKRASAEDFSALEAEFAQDERKGVQKALEAARKRLEREAQELARVRELYRFENEIAQGKVVVGLDEVGRGPLAGPLTVGAVVLRSDADSVIGLNDSKQISEAKRPSIADEIRASARAFAVVHKQPEDIDSRGIMTCLKEAFQEAIAAVEAQGVKADVVLLDGNPLGIDPREMNVVKGDAKCASIAAASVIAKVERDGLMVAYDQQYPEYDFASSKGYGSEKHRQAIKDRGLTPIHRVSYCQNIVAPTLF